MFVGNFRHSLDSKGRVILPAAFRSRLESGAYMARGLDGCLAVYPADEWERVASNMAEVARRGPRERQAARTFFAGAAEASPDRQGRVLVPANLRDFAGLVPDQEVVVNGAHSRVEIWEAERWAVREREGELAIAAAEDIPDFGL